MLSSDLKLTGHVTVEINGEVVQEVPNLVVTTGKNFVASRIKDSSANLMSHMAVGTNNASPAAGNTSLGTEVARVALDSTSTSANTVTYICTFSAGVGTAGLIEAGLFSASSGGTMLCHTLFGGIITKQAADSMVLTWVLTVS